MSLNKGKQQVGQVGSPNQISYGNQSPAVDAVPLLWQAGDWREYIGTDPTILGWRCTVGGTPGTWVQIDVAAGTSKETIAVWPFVYNGDYSLFVGNTVYGAPATADWDDVIGEGPAVPNLFCVPDLGIGAPDHLHLTAEIAVMTPGAVVANGITIDVVNAAGTILGGGTATISLNADTSTIGNFLLLDIPVADIPVGSSIGLRVTVNNTVLTLTVFWTFTLVLTKN